MATKSFLLAQLEKDIATFLVNDVENRKLTFARASEIAKFICEKLPENITDEDILKILPTLGDHFTELTGIVHKYLALQEEKQKQQIIQRLQNFIKQ